MKKLSGNSQGLSPMQLSRRHFVAGSALLSLSFAALPVSAVLAAQKPGILVAYFSHSGNTRRIAEMIHAEVGGDLVEIRAAKVYPQDFDACVAEARKEVEAQAFPEILTHIPDMGQYRTIFLGYPCWWGTMPRPVFTFLRQNDLSGKRVAPFTTHGGSGLGTSVEDIRKLCPNAHLLKGLAVRGRNVGTAQKTVQDWLQSIVY